MNNKFLEIEITSTRHWWTIGERYMVFANHEDWPEDKKNERGYTFDGKATHYRLLDKEKYILKTNCIILTDSELAEAQEAYRRLDKPNDSVNHPSHYTSGKIEVIEAIEDWELNFHRGQVIKYVARAGKKDPTKTLEDLKKAAWYLNREIKKFEIGK